MPALRDPGAGFDGGDYLLADSSAICAYIDTKHPDHPLIPAEARARGEVIWLDEFADTILMGVAGKLFFNRVVLPIFMKRPGDLAMADAAERDELPRVLQWLDARLAGREFLVGDALTLADISVLMPFANLAGAGHQLDEQAYPHIVRWLARMEARPSIMPIHANARAILAKAKQ